MTRICSIGKLSLPLENGESISILLHMSWFENFSSTQKHKHEAKHYYCSMLTTKFTKFDKFLLMMYQLVQNSLVFMYMGKIY